MAKCQRGKIKLMGQAEDYRLKMRYPLVCYCLGERCMRKF